MATFAWPCHPRRKTLRTPPSRRGGGGPLQRQVRRSAVHSKELCHILQRVGRFAAVKNCVAIGTDRPQIFDRINLIIFADSGERLYMMNMRKYIHDLPINRDEV